MRNADDWKLFNKRVVGQLQNLAERGFKIVVIRWVGGLSLGLRAV
jgi:hypothetical protein